MSTRFSRLLFRSPYCLPPSANRIFSAGRCIVYPFFSAIIPSPLFLPFSANKIFSPAPLLFHRPYCLPLSTNRIFSAGPCNVCAFFSAIVPSPLLFTPLGQQNLFGGTVFWQCVFLGYCSVAYFVLLKCSENRFNVTKISKRAIELIAFFFILLRATKDVSRIKSCSNKWDIGNEPGTTKIFWLARRLITGWRIWLPSAWCCELNVVGILNNTIKGR